MFLKKYPGYFVMLAVLTFAACQNSTSKNEDPASDLTKFPAYNALNDSIQKNPGDAELYLRRAMRLTKQNLHELAFNDFQKAWSLQPSLDVAIPFAANLEILGKHRERISLLESVSQHYADNPRILRLLADAYISGGNPDKALQIYNNIILKDSLNPDVQYEKALLLEQLKDTTGAIKALKTAYAVQGVDTYGLELAHLYAEQKNPAALDICNAILSRDTLRILLDPFFIKGIYYANMKLYQKAIAAFDSCILRDWKTTDAYLEKGRAYFNLGNFNAAMQTFNMAITVTNTDADAYFWLARSYEALHRNEDAVNNYLKAISLDKDFVEARQRLEKLDTGFARHSH